MFPSGWSAAYMPDDFAQDMVLGDRSKIAAVAAFNLSSPHLIGAAGIQLPADAFDQRTITGLAKDNHIADPDFTRRERKTRGQNVVTLTKVRVKAVTADFKNS